MKILKIKNIKRSKAQTYDIEVAKNHNFFCNNFLIHNCTYRGEIGVILYNSSIIGSNLFHTEHSTYLFADNNSFSIKEGDRIAQIIFERYYNFDFIEEELSKTERGGGSYGSTGQN